MAAGEHLAYYVDELVGSMDLEAFHARYRGGDGRRKQPYHPTMMVKVLVYAYVTGVYSSRRIAARLETDVAFMVLAAGNRPATGDLRVPAAEPWGVPGAAGGAGDDGGGDGAGGVREAVGGRHEDAREREPDEVEDARVAGRGGGAPQGGGRRAAGEGARCGRGGGRGVRRDVRGDELPEALRDRKARARALSEAKARLAAERGRGAKDAGESVMPGVPGVPGMPGMPGVPAAARRRRCRRSGA